MVDDIGKEFSDKGMVVLAINVAESKKTVKKYLEQYPRTSKVVMTEDTNLAAMYQANAYPIYVVIDRDGNIAGTHAVPPAKGRCGIYYGARESESKESNLSPFWINSKFDLAAQYERF